MSDMSDTCQVCDIFYNMDDRIGHGCYDCQPFEGVPMRTSMLSPLTDGMEAV